VTLAFVVAKLTGAIDWSWLVVFAPILAYMAFGAVVTICILTVVGLGILIGFKKLKNFLKSQGATEHTNSQPRLLDNEDLSTVRDGTAPPESKKAPLYEERGETSRYIDVEITKDGDLVMMGQDLGELPQKFWGDSDYEFFVYIPARYKGDVYRVLMEKLRTDNPDVVGQFENLKSEDDAILALVKKLYTGNPKAVDQFKDFMRSQGISAEFGSWA